MQDKTRGEQQSAGKKTAGDNQWTSGHLRSEPDRRERRDGPGGENGPSGERRRENG